MERDALLSRLVLTLRTRDVRRYLDRDAGILAGYPVSIHRMVSRPGIPRDVLPGLESLIVIIHHFIFQNLFLYIIIFLYNDLGLYPKSLARRYYKISLPCISIEGLSSA